MTWWQRVKAWHAKSYICCLPAVPSMALSPAVIFTRVVGVFAGEDEKGGEDNNSLRSGPKKGVYLVGGQVITDKNVIDMLTEDLDPVSLYVSDAMMVNVYSFVPGVDFGELSAGEILEVLISEMGYDPITGSFFDMYDPIETT